MADSDTAFGSQLFGFTATETEPMAEPDSAGDNPVWKPMIPVETCGTSEDSVSSAPHSDCSQGSSNLTILYGR